MQLVNKISLKALHQGDIDAWINFAWHYSQARFKEAFKNVGVLVEDESDLEAISNMYKNREDVEGKLKTSAGKSVRFNSLDVIKSIDDDKQELANKFLATKDLFLIKVDKKLGIS